MPLPPSDDRPWPVPDRPWVQAMRWHDLLFAHWPVPAEALRPLVPAPLALETFAGSAWLGVVPFRMTGVRLRGTPSIPGLSAFPEINVRTYARLGDRPGVWFLSLDAASAAAVRVARALYHLPYFRASMSCARREGRVLYRSRRTHRGAAGAEFRGSYAPAGPIFRAGKGSLEEWLTERYCLYARDRRGGIRRCEVHHAPWPLRRAEAALEANSMAASHGVALADPLAPPHLLFAERLDVVAWAPER